MTNDMKKITREWRTVMIRAADGLRGPQSQ